MQKKAYLFNNSFKNSIIFTFLLTLGFEVLIIILSSFFNKLNYNVFDNKNTYFFIYYLIIKVLLESATLSLFSIILPCLKVSFFNEFFYTRSLKRKELLENLFKNYFKYFFSLNIFIIILKILSNEVFINSFNKDNYYFLEGLFVSSLTFFLCLISLSNLKIIFKLLQYGVPLFIYFATIANHYAIAQEIGFILWFIYLFYSYKFILNYNGDNEIVNIGKDEDELLSIKKSRIFSVEFFDKKMELKEYKSLISKKWHNFKFINKPLQAFYTQYFFIGLLIVLYFSIKGAFTYFNFYNDINPNTERLFNNTTPLILMFIFYAILILISPKFIMLSKEELLFTRAISKKEIYLQNFLYQGIILFLVSMFTFLLTNFVQIGNINTLFFISIAIWLYISGEISIIFLTLLASIDLISSIINSFSMIDNSSSLTSSFFINLLNQGYFSSALWLLAFIIRFLDYKWYSNKEIGLFKGFLGSIKNLSQLYIPSLLISFVFISTIFSFNPLIKYLNQPSIDYNDFSNKIRLRESFFYNQVDNKEKIVFIYKFFPIEIDTFNNLIKNPYDEKEYLNIATTYLENLFFDKLNPYPEIKNESVLKAYLDRIDFLDTNINSLKNSPEYLYNKGLYYFLKGNNNLAIETLENLRPINKKYYYFILGYIYENELKTTKALDYYKLALKESSISNTRLPRYILLNKIGNIYWDKKEYTEALKYLVYEEPSGLNYFIKKDYYAKNLLPYLEKIQNNVQTSDLKNKLKSYLNEFKDINKGLNIETSDLTYLEKAEAILKNNYECLDDLVLVKIALGKKEEAKRILESRYIIKNNSDYLNRAKNNKILLALVKLNINKVKSAKKYLLTSDNTNEAIKTLTKEFSNNTTLIEEIKLFKANYDYLYNYFSSKDRDGLNGLNSIDKATYLIKLANEDKNIDKNKIIDINKILLKK
ncbi:MAG: hypothetical protein U0457_09765 [Candidatus Sericytochromatia bacterium]